MKVSSNFRGSIRVPAVVKQQSFPIKLLKVICHRETALYHRVHKQGTDLIQASRWTKKKRTKYKVEIDLFLIWVGILSNNISRVQGKYLADQQLNKVKATCHSNIKWPIKVSKNLKWKRLLWILTWSRLMVLRVKLHHVGTTCKLLVKSKKPTTIRKASVQRKKTVWSTMICKIHHQRKTP